MKNNGMRIFTFIFIVIISSQISFSKTRIVVLPFQNMDGHLELNLISYQLSDSLNLKLLEDEELTDKVEIVPLDSVEMVMADLNLDPTNPQYPSDMWKAIALLNVEKVVTGNFNVQAERFLINAYIYDVATKLPDPEYQVRDIFKKREKIFDSIGIISRKIKDGLKK
jgi:TolB-like protein